MAASPDALTALERSPQAWDEYRKHVTTPIDLTLAQLKGADLRGRIFLDCDLSGSDLEDSNLDGSSFRHTSLNNASLQNASMVDCQFEHVDARNANLDYCAIRNSTFADVDFTKASLGHAQISSCDFTLGRFAQSPMDGVRFSHCAFSKCEFTQLDSLDAHFTACKLLESTLVEARWRAVRLVDCQLTTCSVRDLDCSGGVMSKCGLKRSDITRLVATGSAVDHLDFSDSILREVDLGGIDLPHSTMLGSVIVNCLWPRQRAVVTLTGRHERSPFLLGHPVQDLRGLSPSLRREIADAQYLSELDLKATSARRAFAFRVWGLATAHGQSIVRLSFVTGLLILAMSCALALGDGLISPWPQTAEATWQAIAIVSARFLGIEGPGRPNPNLFQDTVLVAARVSGFFVMGLWIGIAANKLGKLSSE